MIVVIDNYDSFTYNLVQRMWELDTSLDINVIRNDAVTVDELATINNGGLPARIVVSPGPCTPNEAGVSIDVVERFAGIVPILGVCLGHQCIGQLHGMPVVRHPRVVHGKTALVHHDNQGIFEGLSNPFEATRYHSLVVDVQSQGLADGWTVSAWSNEPDDDPDAPGARVVMGLRKAAPPENLGKAGASVEGVQFHPESFMTTEGPLLLANFLGLQRPALQSLQP